MTKQDWMAFNSLMGELALAFRTDISAESIKVYGKHLADYHIDAVRHAVDKSIRTGERFPPVSLLREHASAYRPKSNRQPLPVPQIEQFTEGQKMTPEEIQEWIKNFTADASSKAQV